MFIVNHMLSYIYDNFHHLLNSFNQLWLSPQNLSVYAARIHVKSAPFDICWGLIEGILHCMTRSLSTYNGHKRTNGFKFRSKVARNGLIANIFGPLEGSYHDSFLLAQSGVLVQMKHDEALCVYGDPAYPLSVHLQTGFGNAVEGVQVYNQRKSSVCVSAEWVFGVILERYKVYRF